MKVFSFVPTHSLKKAYSGLILKYKNHTLFVELLKISILMGVFLVSILIYLYYVNLSSTRGYFLRQENQKLNAIQFDAEIVKTKLLEYKQNNRETIQNTRKKREVVNVKAEVVLLPGNTNLSYKF